MNDPIFTMKLNHLSFPSTDVGATAAFFERHLGCTGEAKGESRHLKRPGFDIVIDTADGLAVTWPEAFHLGFELPTVKDVQRLHDRLKGAGVDVKSDVLSHPRGSRFYCRAPGGLQVEINTRSDAADPHRIRFAAFR